MASRRKSRGSRPRNKPVATPPAPIVPRPWWNRRTIAALVLLLLVITAYLPALQGGYVWDDDVYLTENRLLWESGGLRKIWFSLESPSQYFPLVYTTFWFEYRLWGLKPFGYHLVNVLFHIANALLLWRLLVCLGIPGAWLAAAFFALHPVQAESVAWITERKNVLSTFFYLLTILAWLRFEGERKHPPWHYYLVALLSYALALFSKTTVLTLPAVLLLLVWLRGERIVPQRLLEVAPFAAMGAAMGLVTIWWERVHQGTRGEVFDFSLIERLLIAGRAIWFYLGKLLWPVKLTFSYPKWTIDVGNWQQYLWPAAVVAVGVALWYARRLIGRWPFGAAAFFVLTLAPMLGFVSLYTFYYSLVADHYQYVAAIGPLTLAAVVLSRSQKSPLLDRGLRFVLPAVLILGFWTLTWQQGHIYRNTETLWRDTLEKNPSSWMASFNLGNTLFDKKRLKEAKPYYLRTLDTKPDYVLAHYKLGLIYLQEGDLRSATSECVTLSKLCPKHTSDLLAAIRTYKTKDILP